jgi:hypothetical protein
LLLEYAFSKVQENQVGLKLNGAHQILAYADDVNLLRGNIDNVKKNTETLTDASRNAGQDRYIIIANRCFENMSQFKYLGMTVINLNLIQEGVKRRLNSVNSVQNLLSSCLLSKNLKIRIHKTIILPVVLYGCETWSLKLREEHRLAVFENRVLRRIFGPKRDEVTGEWRKPRIEEHRSPSIIKLINARRMR